MGVRVWRSLLLAMLFEPLSVCILIVIIYLSDVFLVAMDTETLENTFSQQAQSMFKGWNHVDDDPDVVDVSTDLHLEPTGRRR